ASSGSPAGSTGVSATAITAPVPAATLVDFDVSVGRASASMTAGNVASRPNASVFRTAEPSATPSSTDRLQMTNSPTPQPQNADRRRAGSEWRSANATDSSVITCVPSSRTSQRRTTPRASLAPVRPAGPTTSATANPYGNSRVFSTAPASTAASGDPPASTTPTAAICAPPAKTSSDSATGTHQGSPPPSAVAPNDTPTIPSARHTRLTSRSSPGDAVRQKVRMFTIMNTSDLVRQTEQNVRWSEHNVR